MTARSPGEWYVHDMLMDMCPVCYHREWVSVSAQTFVHCYGMRIDAGMEIDVLQKIQECSHFVGYCTCQSY